MPPANTRVSLLSATCLATVTHVPMSAVILPGRSVAARSLTAVSLASGLALTAPAPVDAAIIYTVVNQSTGTMSSASGNTVTTTATGGLNPSSVTILPTTLTNILVGKSTTFNVAVDNAIDSKVTNTNRSVTFSFTNATSGVTTGPNATLRAGLNGLRNVTVTTTPTVRGASVAGSFTVSASSPGVAAGNVGSSGSSDTTNVTINLTAVSAVASQTGNTTVYALAGGSATQSFAIKNVGDGNASGLTNSATEKTNLWGSAAVTNGDGWSGSVANFDNTIGNSLTDNLTAGSSRVSTFTYAPAAGTARGSATSQITVNYTSGSTNNAGSEVTTVLTGTTVAPVASTTALATLGPVRVGTSTTGSLTVKNIGDGNLAGADNGTTVLSNLRGAVSISGSSAITGGGTVNLADSSSQTYMFTYAPTARGNDSATISTAFTNGSSDGKNLASTSSNTVTGTAVGPEFDANVAGKNASSGAIINGGTILFGEAVGGLTLQDLLISNLSDDTASKALTDLTLTNVTITGSTEFSFSLSGFDSGNTGFVSSATNAALSNTKNGDGQGSIAIQFVNKAGSGSAQLRIETDEGAALGGAGAIYVYNLIFSVPEPGTIAVFGAGLLGLAISRQRRKGRSFVALTAKPEEDKPASAG